MFLVSCLFIFYPTNVKDSKSHSEKKDESSEIDPVIKDIETPKSSVIGTHPWWHVDWPNRILIDITNQESVDLYNYGVYIDFPYGEDQYKDLVNESLKDLRIVEYKDNIGYERKFYFFKDVPSVNITRIFFNTNVSAYTGSPERDTYLYFGNMKVGSTAVKDGLGYIKNGDFEYIPDGQDPTGNPSVTPYSYDPVGWNWSDNVPDDVAPYYNVGQDYPHDDETFPTEWWQNCLVDTQVDDVKVYEGSYSYKWGSNATSIPQYSDDIDESYDHDYAGVLYSNAFVIPTVGDGNPSTDKIYLNIWRNIRACGFDYRSNSRQSRRDIDGYFVRLINASKGLSSNPDNHELIAEIPPNYYLEMWIGVNRNNEETNLRDFTTGSQTGSVSTYNGGLMDDTTFDVSDYMGQNVSLQIGMIGDESHRNHDLGYGQVDDIRFSYQVDTALNELHVQKSDITVIIRDVDGRIVPNAEVSLVQDNEVLDTQTTDDKGEYIFTNMLYDVYNFTVNYTLSPGVEKVVFNSTHDNLGTSRWNIYNVTSHVTYSLYCDIWTINFEIDDWDDEPLESGYINVYDYKDGNLLTTLNLDSAGTATFRWSNASQYYYDVYFDDADYAINDILLNSSYIYRADYESNGKKFIHPFDVNKTNIGTGGYYKVSERIYTGGLNDFGLQMLIKANITLSNMKDQIDNVTVNYIDINNQSTSSNLVYENLSYPALTEDYFIELDLRSIDNDKLKGELYAAYGLQIVVQGQNSSTCNGIIKIDTIEKCHVYNKTAISRMHILVRSDIDFSPIYPAAISITNGSNSITTLTTNIDGWASHDSLTYKPFKYLRGYSYNMTMKRDGADKDFIVNSTDPLRWQPLGYVGKYNYTLNENSTITLDMEVIESEPSETEIELLSATTDVIWKNMVNISVNVTYSPPGDDNWYVITEGGDYYCKVKSWDPLKPDIVLTEKMIRRADLTYSVEINSSRISAGDDIEEYWFIIYGITPGYAEPDDLYIDGTVKALDTTLDLIDYDTRLLITEASKEFEEVINITVRFYNISTQLLRGATITFDWLGLQLKPFKNDPLNPGYHYVSVNTSEADSIGSKFATIRASLQTIQLKQSFSVLMFLKGQRI